MEFNTIEEIVKKIGKKREGFGPRKINEQEERKRNSCPVRTSWTKFLGEWIYSDRGKEHVNSLNPADSSRTRDLYLMCLSKAIQKFFFGGATTIKLNTPNKVAELKVPNDEGLLKI
jgi:hypothetical protein